MVRSRALIATGIHVCGFGASFLLMRWSEARLGMYQIMQGPADKLSNSLIFCLVALYSLALVALAVVALRDRGHPIKAPILRTALVFTTTQVQMALGLLILGLGMIFAAGGIPQG